MDMKRFLHTKQTRRRYVYYTVAMLLVICTLSTTLKEEIRQDTSAIHHSRIILQVQSDDTSAASLPSTTSSPSKTSIQANNTKSSNVKILSSEENKTCDLPSVAEFPVDLFTSYQRKHGAIFVHLFVALYMFVGLAIVCDYYFISSLEVICLKLKIQADVAGASLMAIGSSAPELFASLIGVFITKGDIGIGAILGSAVFNVLFVLGICALVATMKLNLAWYPVTRDTLCYSVTLICLAIVIFDGLVTWKEAATMLMLYASYLVLMWFNERIEKSFYLYTGDEDTLAERFHKTRVESHAPETPHLEKSCLDATEMQLPQQKIFFFDNDEETDSEENIYPTEKPKKLCDIPEDISQKIKWVITLPINAIFFITIPDIRRRCFHGYVTLTFVMSIIWIGFLTYILIWMVTIVGFTINIPDTVMGLTLIAFGSSVPDALSSVYVAKLGKGDMAVAQALGSNVFDILFGLGLPWLIKTLIFDRDSTIEVQSVGMLISCFIIFVLMLSTLGALYYENFCLSKRLGWIFVSTYALFLVISVLLELYIWSAYHLPTCI